MSTIHTLITGATVAVAGVGVAAVVASTGTASAGPASRSESFAVRAHQTSQTNIDLGKSGFSAGDQGYFVGPLTRHGSTVGRLVGTCTTARAGRSSVDQLCEFVLHLGKGQITAAGTVRAGQSGPGTFTLPILGGTGRYQSAAGQIAVTATSGRTVPIKVSLR
jgi:hypothetical protein